MRPMSFSLSLPLAAGFAIALSSAALAEPAVSSTPIRAGRMTDLKVDREPLHAAPGPRAASSWASDGTPRGSGFGGAFVTMRDELENFPLETSFGAAGVSAPPTSFTGPEGFEWPLNNLRGQGDGSVGSGWVRMVDLSSTPVSGPNDVVNASKALRIKTIVAQDPGGFFTGANLRFGGLDTGIPTLALEPLPGANARVSAEHWISSIDTLYSFEAVAVFTGFLTARLMWGGTCVDNAPGDCWDLGLPPGPLLYLVSLGYDISSIGPIFLPATYCEDTRGNPIPGCVPPPGLAIGDYVPPPIGQWSRFVYESTSDGRSIFLLDLLDGSGEVTIYSNSIITSPYLDRVGWNASFEAQDEFMLVDNIEASGPIYQPPIAPPLTCPYLDDMEWLDRVPLLNQSPRWEAAMTSQASVISDGARGQVVSQINNVTSDNKYRREMSTELLASSVTMSNDLVATVEVRTTGSTVRGFGLFGSDGLAARVYFGREGRGEAENPFYEPSVYVQINAGYEPVDDLDGNPDDNIPVIGVDVADTDYDWGTGVYRTLELRLSANGALRVSIDGQRIYTGVGAFANAIDRFAFESENNSFGSGSSLRINDVTLTCDASSCAADFDLDDAVTFADLNAVLSNFGASGLPSGTINPGDANSDGVVDFSDLNAVLSSFGAICD